MALLAKCEHHIVISNSNLKFVGKVRQVFYFQLKSVISNKIMDLEIEQDEESKCSKCLFCCRKVFMFLLSHVGLISLVVGYCIMGAFTFEALESSHELKVGVILLKINNHVDLCIFL